MATENKMKIGVAGIGSIGLRHARLLSGRPEVSLCLCDPAPAGREAARNLAPAAEITESFERLLDWKPDGLVIATPDRFHVEQVNEACQRQIAVLVEKPLAENLEQGMTCREPVKYNRGRVLVGYPLHFCQVALEIKKLLEQKTIGTVVSFQALLGGYDSLRLARNRFAAAERNKLYADYSHEWDYIAWFFGPFREVAAVSHQSGNLELTQNPNVVDGLASLQAGITGAMHLDYVQSPGKRSITIIGDKGTLHGDIGAGTIALALKGEAFARQYAFRETADDIFMREHQHFLDIVAGRAEPLITIEQGLGAIAVADALIAAAESRQWQAVNYDFQRCLT